jgi:hypothetical protein
MVLCKALPHDFELTLVMKSLTADLSDLQAIFITIKAGFYTDNQARFIESVLIQAFKYTTQLTTTAINWAFCN